MAETYKPMDAFDSMTESTFIIKPKTKTKTKSNANSKSDLAADDGYVTLLQGREPIESMQLRKRLFAQLWQPLEEELFTIEKQVNNVGVTEVCDFVDSSYGQIERREQGQVAQPFAEVSAAVTFAGINTGDHGKLFQSLQDQLLERGHHVALLESQYCNTLPNLQRSLLEQMFNSIYADTDAGPSAFGGTRTVAYDLGLLQLWWANSVCSGKKAVVVLQDFEGFAPTVVDDFIRIVGGYCDVVPIVLVLGLATSYECVHQSLTKASISMLNVERFNLQRSKQCIDTAIHRLFVQGHAPLCFGAEAYKSLLDQFLLYNFSIAGFVKKLKYAAMDFFYAQPLSVLASMLEPNAAVSACSVRLSSDQVELIRMQRSVQRFLERRTTEDDGNAYVRQALSDDGFFQDTVLPQMARALVMYRRSYCLGIDAVVEIQSMAPEAMQKPVRTLHYYGVGQQFDDCTHWKTLLAVVRRMKTSEMTQLLQKLCRLVDGAADIDWDLVADGIHIPELIQGANELLANPDGSEIPDVLDSSEPKKRTRTRTEMEHRPFLLFDNGASDAQLNALEKCCEAIEAMLRGCLISYHDVALNEVFYYRHSFLLDTAFSAQPRAAVQMALGKSHYYVSCDCCAVADADDHGSDDEDQRITPAMHDTSIAYRLHQECGRLINLYDWHASFSSVVERESQRTAASQGEIQARFMRAVEEMRFLGFIKSTQRKTDHVVRLTWGM
ncbi:Origin recognition complex subunit 3 [Coemansia sp. RSA 1822]|nr:Origin recognition complex subunit 3 [Coemansia sp. RSA 638]KAJ2123945.1 Origin recognition complex subunit 3 [Coemansia sp. RSA 720]KAJ2539430.1 Origin recognition complex subunit 3 [Coemansia sp. RSA 1853]KAJ2563049.1 Origin recognition complex subunit 3 [Coemansia sp. RSA 1822]